MLSRRSPWMRLHRSRLLVTLFVTSSALIGVSCGEGGPSSKQSQGGLGSASASGVDLTQVEGWQDPSIPAGLSDTEACVRFQRATCERKAECGIDTPDCDSLIAHCPDVLFSPGSSLDAQSAWECAFVLRQRSCEDVYLNRFPDCYEQGTRKAGEPCVGPAQCQTLACSAGMGDSCGQCLPRLGKDQACASSDGAQSAACEAGLKCQAATFKCAEPAARSFDVLDLGVDCSLAEDACGPGLYCRAGDSVGLGTCAQQLSEDAECTESRACAKGLYCFQMGMRCIPVPETGKKCGADVATGNYIWCQDDAYCDNQTWKCEPLPIAGEPCAETLFSNGRNVCSPSARCDVSLEAPTCIPLFAVGEACAADAECQPGLSCVCGQTATAGGSDCPSVCSVVRSFGGSCEKLGELCNAASSCIDGICQPNQSEQLFQNLCGS